MKKIVTLATLALFMVSCGSNYKYRHTTVDPIPDSEICVWDNGRWATDWMKAYVDFFENAVLEYNGENVKDVFLQWSLVFIDNDDIPEMVLHCPGAAYGNMVLSYYGGKVTKWSSRRCNLEYIPHSGLLSDKDGSMGEYWDKVVRLERGQFTEIYNHTDILYQSHDKIDDTTGADEYFCVLNGDKTMRIGFEDDCHHYDSKKNKMFPLDGRVDTGVPWLVPFPTSILRSDWQPTPSESNLLSENKLKITVR